MNVTIRFVKACYSIIITLVFSFIVGFYRLVSSTIVISDIDNTLADTWPKYLVYYDSNIKRLMDVEPILPVVNVLYNHYQNKTPVVFLSTRGLRYFFITRNWLLKQNIRWGKLFLVSSPNHKIFLVKLCSILFDHVTYYDDLSYNHEFGAVRFYENSINELKKMKKIDYYGYDWLMDMRRVFKNVEEQS